MNADSNKNLSVVREQKKDGDKWAFPILNLLAQRDKSLANI